MFLNKKNGSIEGVQLILTLEQKYLLLIGTQFN